MFHLIYLSICKKIHGEFSKEYFFLTQKYKGKYPNLNVRLRKCFGTEAILKFENLIIRNTSFPVYNTLHSILFEKFAFGSDIKNIVRDKGKSSCVNYLRVGEDTIKIIGYNERILNVSAILLFFFCNGKYFMGEYFFSNYRQSVSIQLAKTILKRYSIEVEGDLIQFYIEDEQGSILYFYDHGFNLSVKYFNASFCHSYEKLQSIFQQQMVGNQKQSLDLHGSTLENIF